jgi:hypothetical protein
MPRTIIVKGKKGFQKLPKEDRLTKRVSCYLSENEYKLFKAKLDSTGQTAGEFIRQLIQLRIMK